MVGLFILATQVPDTTSSLKAQFKNANFFHISLSFLFLILSLCPSLMSRSRDTDAIFQDDLDAGDEGSS